MLTMLKQTMLASLFLISSIVIIDDGIGMSKSTICENWMHVGKSDKGYSLSGTEDNDGRVLAGSKGVGRFCLSPPWCIS